MKGIVDGWSPGGQKAEFRRTDTRKRTCRIQGREADKPSGAMMVAVVALTSSLSLSAHSMEGIRIEPGIEAKEQYFQTVPQGLEASDDGPGREKSPKLSSYLQGPKGKEIQQCTRRCTSTCIRGGQGAPGLGPMALRKEAVVFKEGYRSGKYCLSECLQICALQINGKK